MKELNLPHCAGVHTGTVRGPCYYIAHSRHSNEDSARKRQQSRVHTGIVTMCWLHRPVMQASVMLHDN